MPSGVWRTHPGATPVPRTSGHTGILWTPPDSGRFCPRAGNPAAALTGFQVLSQAASTWPVETAASQGPFHSPECAVVREDESCPSAEACDRELSRTSRSGSLLPARTGAPLLTGFTPFRGLQRSDCGRSCRTSPRSLLSVTQQKSRFQCQAGIVNWPSGQPKAR